MTTTIDLKSRPSLETIDLKSRPTCVITQSNIDMSNLGYNPVDRKVVTWFVCLKPEIQQVLSLSAEYWVPQNLIDVQPHNIALAAVCYQAWNHIYTAKQWLIEHLFWASFFGSGLTWHVLQPNWKAMVIPKTSPMTAMRCWVAEWPEIPALVADPFFGPRSCAEFAALGPRELTSDFLRGPWQHHLPTMPCSFETFRVTAWWDNAKHVTFYWTYWPAWSAIAKKYPLWAGVNPDIFGGYQHLGSHTTTVLVLKDFVINNDRNPGYPAFNFLDPEVARRLLLWHKNLPILTDQRFRAFLPDAENAVAWTHLVSKGAQPAEGMKTIPALTIRLGHVSVSLWKRMAKVGVVSITRDVLRAALQADNWPLLQYLVDWCVMRHLGCPRATIAYLDQLYYAVYWLLMQPTTFADIQHYVDFDRICRRPPAWEQRDTCTAPFVQFGLPEAVDPESGFDLSTLSDDKNSIARMAWNDVIANAPIPHIVAFLRQKRLPPGLHRNTVLRLWNRKNLHWRDAEELLANCHQTLFSMIPMYTVSLSVNAKQVNGCKRLDIPSLAQWKKLEKHISCALIDLPTEFWDRFYHLPL